MTDQLPIFVHIIADYGHADDMAFAEVRQALRYALRDKIAHMEASSVPAFDTIATGFKLAQLAINHRMGNRQFFYVNTAPRKDDLAARGNNAGEGLAFVKLKNGVQIVAVNSGYSLAFLKEHAQMIRLINCSAEGSQFRSRDVFPDAFGLVAHGDFSQLGADIAGDIPDMPENIICYTDGYGNLKTSIDATLLEKLDGQKVPVTINGVTNHALVGRGIFSVPDGEMVLSAGSSGWMRTDGMKFQCVECVLRGGSAAAKFNKPQGGAEVKWGS
ncbi:MAG: hypothetical protein JWM96_583 [Alphaproteobacteria bacterium]|nr:hypothetical protein [Alphaproteobacteria bacterium]